MSDEDTSSSEEEMDSEPEVEMKSLQKRSTRGKRMHELIGEDAEADEAFWNQKRFRRIRRIRITCL